MKRLFLLSSILLISIISISYTSPELDSCLETRIQEDLGAMSNTISLSLTPHAPIVINSDSEFEIYPGNGTIEDPFVIEGYNITSTDANGIVIAGTTKYFVIRNCYVDARLRGIIVDIVANGTATVVNNTCNNNDNGIMFYSSVESSVVNNTCTNNTDYGIYLANCFNSTVSNNTCSSNTYNIFFYESGNSLITHNTCTYSKFSLWLSSSSNSIVANNTCNNNNLEGISLSSSSSNSTIVNNTCNNNDNMGIGIYESVNSIVANNTCSNNNHGVFLLSADHSIVANNTCNNNNYGIYFHTSSSFTVTNNTCDNNYYGIFLYSSVGSTVIRNICSNNNLGVELFTSDLCVISYNLFEENKDFGVYLRFDSNNSIIHHNTFVDNNLGGISQAYDDGFNNTWFDSAPFEGNFWSDWLGTGSYAINGSAGAFDLYPLNDPVVPPISEFSSNVNMLIFVFVLGLAIIPLSLITRKRLNNK